MAGILKSRKGFGTCKTTPTYQNKRYHNQILVIWNLCTAKTPDLRFFFLFILLHVFFLSSFIYLYMVIPQQAEVAQGVPGRLRPRIFLTFGTTRVVGRQPYAPAAFTPWEIPGTHFQGLSWPQGTWFRRGEPRKKSPVILPGIDPGTVRLVVQCLNHYATPGTIYLYILVFIYFKLLKVNYTYVLLLTNISKPIKKSSEMFSRVV